MKYFILLSLRRQVVHCCCWGRTCVQVGVLE